MSVRTRGAASSIVRTSVDHGTAFDIAGKGKADSASMIAAVLLFTGARVSEVIGADVGDLGPLPLPHVQLGVVEAERLDLDHRDHRRGHIRKAPRSQRCGHPRQQPDEPAELQRRNNNNSDHNTGSGNHAGGGNYAGLTVEGNDGTDKNSPNYRSLASKIKADCFVGSGVTGDLLAHCIDTALWLNGSMQRVTAMTETFVKERPVATEHSGLSGSAGSPGQAGSGDRAR